MERDPIPIQPTLPISSLIHATQSELKTSNDLIRQAEDAIESAFNNLEKTGLLQHMNQMDINELLNPAIEAHQVFEATDEDIYEVVMDVKRVWEESAKRCTCRTSPYV
ncbi:hypothetical protein PAXRUDRAFT_19614 [Paxillus rubicundulus Ve08.2h10]|uniref:Uncharacterized protein n=1 Tax=Paxillus rubicundulus Ve08.2h10 TaxID=930991 RepID=A0A0D0CHK6_9AGAM|nr:hypothetical protein PAXRUDRAFT_19614 [Paxillus rubicundulus Ve08.2h10]